MVMQSINRSNNSGLRDLIVTLGGIVMKYSRLGNTGLVVSKLTFGGMNLGRGISRLLVNQKKYLVKLLVTAEKTM